VVCGGGEVYTAVEEEAAEENQEDGKEGNELEQYLQPHLLTTAPNARRTSPRQFPKSLELPPGSARVCGRGRCWYDQEEEDEEEASYVGSADVYECVSAIPPSLQVKVYSIPLEQRSSSPNNVCALW
jgi:hypothetical protein